mgnify:CR=1 FL=1
MVSDTMGAWYPIRSPILVLTRIFCKTEPNCPDPNPPTVSDLVLKTKSDTVGVSDPGPFGKFKGQSDMTRYAAASNIPDRGPYRILKGEGCTNGLKCTSVHSSGVHSSALGLAKRC